MRTMEPVRQEKGLLRIICPRLSSLAALCEHQQGSLQPICPQLAAVVMPQVRSRGLIYLQQS